MTPIFRKFKQNKLWRDKAIELMKQLGSIIHWHTLDDKAFEHELKIKLREETEEVCLAQDQPHRLEELADLLEVIHAFCELYQTSFEDLLAIQQAKKQHRGGFSARRFVTIAEHPIGSFGEQYCLNDSQKYPEL